MHLILKLLRMKSSLEMEDHGVAGLDGWLIESEAFSQNGLDRYQNPSHKSFRKAKKESRTISPENTP